MPTKNILRFDKLSNLKHYSQTSIILKRKLFTEKTMSNQNIIDRIKTFEDACAELNIKTDEISCANINSKSYISEISKFSLSSIKIAIIAKALNEGWEPNWDDSNEQKWYPYFNWAAGGFVFRDAIYDYTLAYTFGGSRVCFKSKTLAEYAGKQFIALYNDYLKM